MAYSNDNSTVTVTLSSNVIILYETEYYILFENDTFRDTVGNSMVPMTDTSAWRFRTNPEPDTTPPVLTMVNP